MLELNAQERLTIFDLLTTYIDQYLSNKGSMIPIEQQCVFALLRPSSPYNSDMRHYTWNNWPWPFWLITNLESNKCTKNSTNKYYANWRKCFAWQSSMTCHMTAASLLLTPALLWMTWSSHIPPTVLLGTYNCTNISFFFALDKVYLQSSLVGWSVSLFICWLVDLLTCSSVAC